MGTTRIRPADALRGGKIVDRDGRRLGTLEEVVIDLQCGTAAYALVSAAGAVEKLVAVPWTALALDAPHRRFVLCADARCFARAPALDNDHWPAMADAKWARDVHDSYGVHPYWGESLPGRETLHPETKGNEDENATRILDDCGIGARL